MDRIGQNSPYTYKDECHIRNRVKLFTIPVVALQIWGYKIQYTFAESKMSH